MQAKTVAKSKDLRTLAAKSDPQMIDIIIRHVQNGGSAIDLCREFQIDYSGIMNYIRSKDEYKKRYDNALVDRKEYDRERAEKEYRALSMYNIKDAVHADGTPKKIHEMPESLTAAIKEIDADGSVKFVDKIKALDSHSKITGLLTDKKEITGKVTLVDLLTQIDEAE